MPTSSQTLILQKKIHGVPISGKTTQCLFKAQAKCPVAAVYNLSGCMPMARKSVADYDAVSILGRESAQLFKYHSLPRGFSSILSLEKLSGLLQWQALGGQEIRIAPRASESLVQRRCKSELEREVPDRTTLHRPRSAGNAESSKIHVSPLVFDNLIKLGFSRSALIKRQDCVFDGISSRRGVSSKPLGTTKRAETASCSKITEIQAWESLENKENEAEVQADNLSDVSTDDDVSYEELNRVKPSMHMRKDVPDPRPRAAIFSFRDNDFSSHAEVKYLIETQIGVKVKTVQFDPLDVRSAKPGVHSRWIVDFFSDWDLHVAVKNGLTVGKDKLLFYKHDDIVKREVSTFKYYKTIQDAKKKLKSKSLTDRRASTTINVGRATKSGKNLA